MSTEQLNIDEFVGDDVQVKPEDELAALPPQEGEDQIPPEQTAPVSEQEQPASEEPAPEPEPEQPQPKEDAETTEQDTEQEQESDSPLTDVLAGRTGTEARVPVHVVAKLREDRRKAQEERRKAHEEAKALREQLAQQTQPSAESDVVAEQDPLSQVEDDDVVTVAQMKKVLAAKDAQEQRRRQAEQAQTFAVKLEQSEAKARARLTKEACGDGFDYETVVATGQANLTPGDLLAVQQAGDPAAEFYRRCILNTPEFFNKYVQLRAQKQTKAKPSAAGARQEVTQEKILSNDDFFDEVFAEGG
jgi:hypothetical protein